MAKAALNMMTRTVARYYKQFGIYMTGVDTGWVSPMNEFNNLFDKNSSKAFEEEFVNIPLDELDGAMRCIHPVIEGIVRKNYISGYLLKDYKITNW
jgi:NAD(P)-dependent dehydrogenase (short-subunit alcohol dehydrogenase family)